MPKRTGSKNKISPNQLELPGFGKKSPRSNITPHPPVNSKPTQTKKKKVTKKSGQTRQECLQRAKFFAMQGDVEMANYWKEQAGK